MAMRGEKYSYLLSTVAQVRVPTQGPHLQSVAAAPAPTDGLSYRRGLLTRRRSIIQSRRRSSISRRAERHLHPSPAVVSSLCAGAVPYIQGEQRLQSDRRAIGQRSRLVGWRQRWQLAGALWPEEGHAQEDQSVNARRFFSKSEINV